MAIERRIVHFSGRVQGVGFRYTTARIAGRFDVTGFVKNLSDGRVQLVAEGESDELQSFFDEIERVMDTYIHSSVVDRQAASGGFAGFSIGY